MELIRVSTGVSTGNLRGQFMTTLDAKTVAALDDPARRGVIIFDSEPTLRGFGIRVRHDHSGKVRRTWIMQYRFTSDDGKTIQRRQKLGEFPRMTAEVARKKARTWREKIDKGTSPLRNAASTEADSPGARALTKPITGVACCARAIAGHAAAEPNEAINSRRLITPPKPENGS